LGLTIRLLYLKYFVRYAFLILIFLKSKNDFLICFYGITNCDSSLKL
jgi:hypothetical protein